MIDVEKGWLDGGEASWKDEKTPLGPPPLEVSRGWCKVVFVEAVAVRWYSSWRCGGIGVAANGFGGNWFCVLVLWLASCFDGDWFCVVVLGGG